MDIKVTRRTYAIAVILLTASSVIVQCVIFSETFGEEALTHRAADRGDVYEYVGRAEQLYHNVTFTNVFMSGQRLPGYPLFLLGFFEFAPFPFAAARLAQIILSALMIPIMGALVRRETKNTASGLITAFITAVWAPLYFFSAVLYPESFSLFLFSLLLLCFGNLRHSSRTVSGIVTGFLFLALISMKPNHVLIAIPIAVLVFYQFSFNRKSFRLLFGVFAPVCIGLISWSLFLNHHSNSLVMLSTYEGTNLYVGAGMIPRASLDSTMAVDRFALAHHLADTMPPDYNQPQALLDAAYRDRALQQWQQHPLLMGQYGVLKIAHTFGFLFRDLRDVILALMFLFSIAAAVFVWKVAPPQRMWCMFFGGILCVVALQAFVFLPKQRFKTVMFDLPAIAIIGLSIDALIRHKRSAV